MQRKYINLLAAVLVAAVILFVLGKFLNHSPNEPKTPAASSTAANPADAKQAKEHELKALAVELEKNPNHAPILLRMAQLARELGKPDEAVERLRQLTKADPDNVEGHLELGRALYEANDVSGAIEETNHVLKLNPKNVDGLYNLGAIYANVNKPELARQYWTAAVAAEPQSESGRNAQEGLKKLGPGLPVQRHP
jgi:tetratricopeptide (TPR) repeat protein